EEATAKATAEAAAKKDFNAQGNIDQEAGEGGRQEGQGNEGDKDDEGNKSNKSQEEDEGDKEDTVKYIVVDD
ncbi:hypothetical protein V2W45_1348093, partial [Cenococcum geophilum]